MSSKNNNISKNPSILSIQSSVTLGHVGNSAAVFPMQYRGVNVSALHTLQYSSHVQYSCGFSGTKIPEADVRGILSKLQTLAGADATTESPSSSNNNSSLFSHVLTGYIGAPELVQAIADYIKQLKASTTANNEKPFFFCDPVCGDNGRLYVLQAVAEGIRDQLVPLADAVAPNFFEASFLSGIQIVSDESAMAAAKKIHAMGPRIVVITSYSPNTEKEDPSNPLPATESKTDPNPHISHKTRLHCLLSRKVGDDEFLQDVYAFKNVTGHWVGTGDTFAALILSELAVKKDENLLPAIVQHSIAIMNTLIDDTSKNQKTLGGQRELRIIENRKLFELEGVVSDAACDHVIKSSPIQ